MTVYRVNLDDQRMKLHIEGLCASTKFVANQILNAPNTPSALRDLMPKLEELNNEFQRLDTIIDNKINGVPETPVSLELVKPPQDKIVKDAMGSVSKEAVKTQWTPDMPMKRLKEITKALEKEDKKKVSSK